MATITKGTFIQAAAMVGSVLRGGWTPAPPDWADRSRYMEGSLGLFAKNEYYTRAVQMAEIFILLFTHANPRFDRDRFLDACGLLTPEAPENGKTKVRHKPTARREHTHTL